MYLALPVMAAVLVAQRSRAGYLERDAGFCARMLFVTAAAPPGIHERRSSSPEPTDGAAMQAQR